MEVAALETRSLGPRIREVRKARGIEATEMGVSRSYLTKLETEYQDGSIGCFERICERLDMGLRRFFMLPEEFGRLMMMEDRFVQQVLPHLKQLTARHKEEIVKTLKAASGQS